MLWRHYSLIALIVQNTSVVLLLRYTTTTQSYKGRPYLFSTAVLMQEILKLAVCLTILFCKENCSLKRTGSLLKEKVLRKWREGLSMGLLALFYTLQNNILYLSASKLDVATLQVTYQLKILTTAVCCTLFLGKQLTRRQWISLLLLIVGVCLVQLPIDVSTLRLAKSFNVRKGHNQLVGLSAVVISCLLSGFSSVLFEQRIKSVVLEEASVWTLNIQLGLWALFIAASTCLVYDYKGISANGFLQGYSTMVWLTLAVNSIGGLIIALVLKHADNILKGFATSVAIILSAILSGVIFQTSLSPLFFPGAGIVIIAVSLYAKEEVASPKSHPSLCVDG